MRIGTKGNEGNEESAGRYVHADRDPLLGREIFFYSGSLRNTADDSGSGRSDSGRGRRPRVAHSGINHTENWELKIENVELPGEWWGRG